MVRRLCPDVEVPPLILQMEIPIQLKNPGPFHRFTLRRAGLYQHHRDRADIPNANTIIINNAHQFGMSDPPVAGRWAVPTKRHSVISSAPMSTPDLRSPQTPEDAIGRVLRPGQRLQHRYADMDIRGAGNLLKIR